MGPREGEDAFLPAGSLASPSLKVTSSQTKHFRQPGCPAGPDQRGLVIQKKLFEGNCITWMFLIPGVVIQMSDHIADCITDYGW